MFYGDTSKVQNHLLFHLKLLKLLPATESRNGFYAIESRFGREVPKKLSLEPECNGADAILLYRYLSDEELKILETSAEKLLAFYILPHKLFDREYIKAKLLNRIPQAGFISDFSGTSFLQSFNLVRKEFKATNILRLKATSQQQDDNESAGSMIHFPVIILFVLKIFMSPANEIRRYSILLKYSNQRILSRFIELFFVINFVMNFVINFVMNFVMNFVIVVLIKMGFGIRHAVLISAFRFYGLAFDLCTFSYRFAKLVLLYPVFKIYWFLAFQYKKRIKKMMS